MKANSLYICYFGIREPLVQTQVLPYLRELIRNDRSDAPGLDVSITLLTFEPSRSDADLTEFQSVKYSLGMEGIAWKWLPYHKRPSAIATAWDVFRGAWVIRREIRILDILHARSHVPALMAVLARVVSGAKPKLLFDIRGFMPEEYADAGIWTQSGLLFRTVKWLEKWMMKEADGFVVLTQKAKEILFPESSIRPVEVIPCCVDLDRFTLANDSSRRAMRQRLGLENRFTIAYVGSFGGWYMTEETADFLAAARSRDVSTFALIMTQSDPSAIEPLLRNRGFNDGDYLITRVSAKEIPVYLSAADAAVSLIKPCYSKQASSPTKNAEYLACGLPVVATDGVGDTTEIIETDKVGVVVREFMVEAYGRALDELDEMLADRADLQARCGASAQRRFDLETVGGVRYRRLYSRLLQI